MRRFRLYEESNLIKFIDSIQIFINKFESRQPSPAAAFFGEGGQLRLHPEKI